MRQMALLFLTDVYPRVYNQELRLSCYSQPVVNIVKHTHFTNTLAPNINLKRKDGIIMSRYLSRSKEILFFSTWNVEICVY